MGSIIDKLREDEEEYFWICSELGIKTFPKIQEFCQSKRQNMYSHLKEICDQFGVKTKWELKDIIGKIKKRDAKLDELLNDKL